MQPISLDAYSVPQRLLHWAMALMIFFNLLFPDGMNAWNRAVRTGEIPSPDQISSANVHAYFGIGILVLAIVRVCLRIMQGAPQESEAEPKIFRVAARIAHLALYTLIFVMPLSGIAAYYGGIDAVGELHGGILKAILWAIITAHVAGALAHQFYWKTNVLRRMTIGG